ncbi:MAG: hypothetical protein R3C99_14870 [Pirellulaceae bacterium]
MQPRIDHRAAANIGIVPRIDIVQPHIGIVQPNIDIVQPNIGIVQPNIGIVPTGNAACRPK